MAEVGYTCRNCGLMWTEADDAAEPWRQTCPRCDVRSEDVPTSLPAQAPEED